MARLLLVFLTATIFGFILNCKGKYAFISWSGNCPKIVMTDEQLYQTAVTNVSHATFDNEINTTGWAFLEIQTNQHDNNEKQAFAAGFLEGYLTRDLIWMHWQNMLKGYCYNKTDVCDSIERFIDVNERYINDMICNSPVDPYWHQMKLYYIQLQGLAFGYNKATTSMAEQLSTRDMIWINMMGDLDELALALTFPKTNSKGMLFGGDHCTGLVKLLPDHTDLYISQVTWNSYQSMLRIQKKYELHYQLTPSSSEIIPGYKMSLTSYPAFIQSTDDFYITSSSLVAAETTIGNSNRSLFEHVRPVGQVLEYARAVVASRLAATAAQWVDVFRRHNSGTYNNQWYILDYKNFKPKVKNMPAIVQPGLLWVIEQLPGYTEAADLTELLVRKSYFPSYNIPFFPTVFNMSGGQARIDIYGDWFAYDQNPRAKIIKLKQASIHNLRDMYTTMRYNDFKHDPLARCEQCAPPYSACNAIAARNDLNPANGTYPFRALGHRSHGATDAKITTYWLHKTYQFLSVSSPTYNICRGIPPFKWSDFDLGKHISHVGHPDVWAFEPLVHKWKWN